MTLLHKTQDNVNTRSKTAELQVSFNVCRFFKDILETVAVVLNIHVHAE